MQCDLEDCHPERSEGSVFRRKVYALRTKSRSLASLVMTIFYSKHCCPCLLHAHAYTLSHVNRAFDPVPNSFSAPCSPVEFGRMKTQFCQAESRPNTFVIMLSAPGKRRLASMPVSASGERLARSSMATRTSSSQSRSSGATV